MQLLDRSNYAHNLGHSAIRKPLYHHHGNQSSSIVIHCYVSNLVSPFYFPRFQVELFSNPTLCLLPNQGSSGYHQDLLPQVMMKNVETPLQQN